MHTALNQLKPKLNRKPHKKQIVPFFFTVNFQIAQLYFQDNKKKSENFALKFCNLFLYQSFFKTTTSSVWRASPIKLSKFKKPSSFSHLSIVGFITGFFGKKTVQQSS